MRSVLVSVTSVGDKCDECDECRTRHSPTLITLVTDTRHRHSSHSSHLWPTLVTRVWRVSLTSIGDGDVLQYWYEIVLSVTRSSITKLSQNADLESKWHPAIARRSPANRNCDQSCSPVAATCLYLWLWQQATVDMTAVYRVMQFLSDGTASLILKKIYTSLFTV